MHSYQEPYIINFSKIGDTSIGYISVAEFQKNIPFDIARVFWTYFTPEEVERGRHAHYKTEQVLIAVSGHINVTIEMPGGEKKSFLLEKPHMGLYVPPHCWHTMQYSHSSVQLVLASTHYDEKDYIRSFDEFKKIYVANGG